MKKFMDMLEKYLLPIAGKMASQRHMASIKDAFIAILPVTLVGSVAVLLNVFFRDIPNAIAVSPYFGASVQEFFAQIPTTFDWLIQINGAVWWGTLALTALLFSFTLAYNLAKKSDVDPLPAGIIGVAVLFVTIPQNYFLPEGTVNAAGEAMTSVWGAVSSNYLGAAGLFTALIMVTLMMELYVILMKKKITIKLPESVPSNVSAAFTAVIPGSVAIFGSAIVAYFMLTFTGGSINDFVTTTLMEPLMNLSQGYGSVMLITLFTQLFWFFGIHGMMVLTPIYESIWGVAQIENVNAFMTGETIPYMWTRLSFDLYGMFGGSGATLGLVIGMFVFGKRAETKSLRAIAGPPGIFNINEPLSFGMPIVLNPIYFIPWILVPMVTMTIGYIATATGFAGPVVAAIPWVTPVGLSAFLATSGSIGAAITQIICLVVSIVMWAPFLIAAERAADKMYGAEEQK